MDRNKPGGRQANGEVHHVRHPPFAAPFSTATNHNSHASAFFTTVLPSPTCRPVPTFRRRPQRTVAGGGNVKSIVTGQRNRRVVGVVVGAQAEGKGQ